MGEGQPAHPVDRYPERPRGRGVPDDHHAPCTTTGQYQVGVHPGRVSLCQPRYRDRSQGERLRDGVARLGNQGHPERNGEHGLGPRGPGGRGNRHRRAGQRLHRRTGLHGRGPYGERGRLENEPEWGHQLPMGPDQPDPECDCHRPARQCLRTGAGVHLDREGHPQRRHQYELGVVPGWLTPRHLRRERGWRCLRWRLYGAGSGPFRREGGPVGCAVA